MKKFVIILMAVALIANVAVASEKSLEKGPFVVSYVGDSGVLQGGDDIANATAIGALPYSDTGTTTGYIHDYTFTTETAPDVVYVYTPGVDKTVDVLLCGSAFDTKLYIMLADLTVEYANDDNSAICGAGNNSAIIGAELTAGVTYYIVVTGYSAAEGDYVLDMTGFDTPPPPPAPANDLCDDGEILPLGAYSIDGDTTAANDDYTLTSSGCTGFSANGNDVVYVTCLADGDMFDVAMTTTTGFDASIYLVSDCADPEGSCVAGSDVFPTGEAFSYQNITGSDQQLYLIVDAFSSGAGEFNISGNNGSNCQSVAIDETNWGSLKGMYR